ncbi:MAG: hypothetical protein NUV93_04535, partial [Firmicutes bacterium]|nr:hypothetical protein [Bacillota bacterium]
SGGRWSPERRDGGDRDELPDATFGWPVVARAALAAAAALAVGFAAATMVYLRQPVTYLALDINPSIELGLNRPGLVVIARALNGEGSLVLDRASSGGGLLHRPAAEAVSAIMESAADEGFLSDREENVIHATLVGAGGAAISARDLREWVGASLERRGLPAYLRVNEAGPAERAAAREEGISLNLYLLRQKMAESGIPTASVNWKGTLRDVVRQVGARGVMRPEELVGGRKAGDGAPNQPRVPEGRPGPGPARPEQQDAPRGREGAGKNRKAGR